MLQKDGQGDGTMVGDLSVRLLKVAELVGEVKRIADVGSDHGLLPIALLESGKIEWAVAIDIAEGPCETTRRAIERAGLQERVDVLKGDGLHPLLAGEVDRIIIAGMGAQSMWDILTSIHAVTILAEHPVPLVLQPMAGSGLLRYYAQHFGYQLERDIRVVDGGIIYEVLLLTPQAVHIVPQEEIQDLRASFDLLPPMDRFLWTFGTQGLIAKCPHLERMMYDEYEKRGRALKELAYPMGDRAFGRAEQLRAECGALLRLHEEYYGTEMHV